MLGVSFHMLAFIQQLSKYLVLDRKMKPEKELELSHNSEGVFSYPEPAIALLTTEVWPAVPWVALKLPLRCRLLLIGERDRKADAPSLMPAAAWLVKEPSLPKWTEPNVDGPAKRFATRLLGYKRERSRIKGRTRENFLPLTVLGNGTCDHCSNWAWPLDYHRTSDSDSESGCVSEGTPVASLWTLSFSWLMKCVVSWGGCHWGLVIAKCIRDNSVFPSSACW